ncbi:hypothetical protein PILCRDRAFT_820085 [Piloderma croceum F 1598]|uniref:Uncharacterized protein n=1 Tax=Piloderma croceum (strain F 1598) TaxID=765440 RepID=A0A0C3B928_PILCF|nr:hypothetical protein PILCRDRAFT_820085 [Piloderma croceum F 1598]
MSWLVFCGMECVPNRSTRTLNLGNSMAEMDVDSVEFGQRPPTTSANLDYIHVMPKTGHRQGWDALRNLISSKNIMNPNNLRNPCGP